MDNGIEKFNWDANLAKVTAGWSDGPQFKNPNLSPTMTIVEGIDGLIDQKLHTAPVTEGAVQDVWNQRRAK